MLRPEPRRAVFLDRDGVLNEATVRDGRPYAPRTLDDFLLLPEAAAAVGRLKDAGLLTIVVTNQPDVGRGEVAQEILDAMHARLVDAVGVDAVEVCVCGESCRRYKPSPGMLQDAAVAHEIDLDASFMVGDRWRDIGAGAAAGCVTVLVDRGYTEPLRDRPDHVVAGLDEAVDLILSLVSTPVRA